MLRGVFQRWLICKVGCPLQIRLGCAHLEESLELLGRAGLTGGMSKLAVEIREGLRQLKPDCLIEHLKVGTRGSRMPLWWSGSREEEGGKWGGHQLK